MIGFVGGSVNCFFFGFVGICGVFWYGLMVFFF